jgi:hypothetical protein
MKFLSLISAAAAALVISGSQTGVYAQTSTIMDGAQIIPRKTSRALVQLRAAGRSRQSRPHQYSFCYANHSPGPRIRWAGIAAFPRLWLWDAGFACLHPWIGRRGERLQSEQRHGGRERRQPRHSHCRRLPLSEPLADLQSFSKQFGLPVPNTITFQVVYANGVQPPRDLGWELEEALDVEYAHAMAPNATLYLVEAASASDSALLAARWPARAGSAARPPHGGSWRGAIRRGY